MKTYPALTPALRDFIAEQAMFFVATAPRADSGHVNLSPKGLDGTFRVLDDHTVAYLDLGGSGIETQAHIQENGRLTLMFCAFQGRANILRLYGRGEVYDFDHPDWERWRAKFAYRGNARAVIVLRVERIQDSCGWGVPLYRLEGQREQLPRWADAKPKGEWESTRRHKNATSIDGLPGMGGA